MKLILQQLDRSTFKNSFYNGCSHDNYVSNVFVCAERASDFLRSECSRILTRLIVAGYGNVYRALQEVCERTSGLRFTDSAWCRERYHFILKSGQHLLVDINNYEEYDVEKEDSARQLGEWGMCALQGYFHRLNDRMMFEERSERQMIIMRIVLLFNFRKPIVVHNQLLITYITHMTQEWNDLFLVL